MKKTLFIALCLFSLASFTKSFAATTESSPIQSNPDPNDLSWSAKEVVRLSEAGIRSDVIIAYIEKSQLLFDLDSEDIIYLNDLGITSDIVTAMLRRDSILREGTIISPGKTNEMPVAVAGPVVTTNYNAHAPPTIYVTNAPVEVSYFYDSLRPYGTWIDLNGVGWCWQPTIVVIERTWRPYWEGGHWIYTDLGWYWRSDYTWGWAPFHYGRWHHHARHGWVWLPDLTWGPAWVSWRFSDTHCGWAPLPPRARFVAGKGWFFKDAAVGVDFDFHLGRDAFVFVELNRMHERHPNLHGIPSRKVRDVFSHTRVANRYVVEANNRIANRGVPVEKVTEASHHQFHPIPVRELPVPNGHFRRDRVAHNGDQTVLYRPELAKPAAPPPTVAQKAHDGRPIIPTPPHRPPAAPPRAAPHVQPQGPRFTPPPTPHSPPSSRTDPGSTPQQPSRKRN